MAFRQINPSLSNHFNCHHISHHNHHRLPHLSLTKLISVHKHSNSLVNLDSGIPLMDCDTPQDIFRKVFDLRTV